MWVPNRNLTFPAVTGINVKDVTVRIGESYDLFGNGKTALKVSVGKYPLGVSTVGNPAGIVNTITRSWVDTNKNFIPDCNLLNLQANSGADTCGSCLEPPVRAADVGGPVRQRHALRLREPGLQLGVLDKRRPPADLARGSGRRLLPALVR